MDAMLQYKYQYSLFGSYHAMICEHSLVAKCNNNPKNTIDNFLLFKPTEPFVGLSLPVDLSGLVLLDLSGFVL